MFKALIEASVRFRWFVVLVTALVAASGLSRKARETVAVESPSASAIVESLIF